ncbi:MAG: carbon monoxide dehydrogenase subunit G [Thaumarchaeota archaeon]|nr:carbon monoxide dehydrogenase subunit G [Nitrososphaerota archaeon]
MHYEGTFDASVPKEELFEFVTDPAQIIAILPGVEQSRVTDRNHFFVKARVGAGPLRGSIGMNFTTTGKKKDTSAKIVGRGEGMQSVVDLTLTMSLEDAPSGSRARWSADAKVGGLLASVAGRLIEGIADGYIKQVTENLRRKVTER